MIMKKKSISKLLAVALSVCMCVAGLGVSPASVAADSVVKAEDNSVSGVKLVFSPTKLKLKRTNDGHTKGEYISVNLCDSDGNVISKNVAAEFSSSDKFVIKVADYTDLAFVTGVGTGTAYVRAKYNYNGQQLEASCKVTVELELTPEEKKQQEQASKKPNPIIVSGKRITTTAYKTKTFSRKKVIRLSKAKGTVTYKKITGDSRIKISKKTGKVTVKKGLTRGTTYNVMLEVTAKGTKKYAKATKTVFFWVKVNF